MFNTKFDNGYQNMSDPGMNIDENGYRIMPSNPYSSYNNQDPYDQSNAMMSMIPYPTPPTETNSFQNNVPVGYAKGGKVKRKRGGLQNSPYSILAEMVRQQGEGGDTILAHINPTEAMLLKAMGGSGTINKKTGLPQFGPVMAIGGALLGNAVLGGTLGGLAGVAGGALGGVAHAAMSGKKNLGRAALQGAGIGAIIPTVASLAGSGLSSLGATSAGSALTGYGERNAIIPPALGRMFGGSGEAVALSSQASAPQSVSLSNMFPSKLSGTGGQLASGTTSAGAKAAGNGGLFGNLLGNTGSFLSDPKNLLTLASLAASAKGSKKDKPKTPEQLASEQKRLEKALMLSPEERAAKEAELLAEARMHRKIARNQFLPEERLGNLDPIYRKSHTPEEQKKSGRWFSYYNNPDFSGEPTPFKDGGLIEGMMNGAMPTGSSYIDGIGGGQDDNVRTRLPDNSYIIDASTVSDLGDGNSRAGANSIAALISNGEYYISPEDVAKFGKLGAQRLNALVKNVRKHKGGSVKLPPKAKPISSYLK